MGKSEFRTRWNTRTNIRRNLLLFICCLFDIIAATFTGMSSLGMLNDYGSSSDDDVPHEKASASQNDFVSDVALPAEKDHTRQMLPGIDDLFSGKFNPSTVALKRSAKSAEINGSAPLSLKVPKQFPDTSPAAARVINSTSDHLSQSSAVLVPPQLKRPNHVTEESALWNSRKGKSKVVNIDSK